VVVRHPMIVVRWGVVGVSGGCIVIISEVKPKKQIKKWLAVRKKQRNIIKDLLGSHYACDVA
jgi:hypothetical protein